LDEYGKLPDVVSFDESENRIFLVEAIASLRSVSPKQQKALEGSSKNRMAGWDM
jgi:hypothetical protein